MSVKCLNCGYEMSTWQEFTSTITHVATGVFGILKTVPTNKLMAGTMNHKIGASEGVKCPKCGKVGSWEDM